MFISHVSTLLAASFVSTTLSSPLADISTRNNGGGGADFTCNEITIPVTISTQNLVLPVVPRADGSLPTQLVKGSYTIAARFCEPAHTHGKTHVLQLLVHGLTYNRNYWSGEGPPGHGFAGDEYSWIAYAASRGYPTLSIDRLGSGLSSHPDPLTVVQLNAQVETLHQIVLLARSGKLGGGPTGTQCKFTSIVYAGHSFAAILGNAFNAVYPKDLDATILLGWTPQPNFKNMNALFFPALAPAALVQPQKFAGLDANYVEFNSSAAFKQLFYNRGSYDPALQSLDYELRSTIALGEGLSFQAQYQNPAPHYTGSVLVLTGQQDIIFCPSTSSNTSDCGTGATSALAAGKSLYPAAKTFDSYVLPGRGHSWNLHYDAQAGFKIAHDWIKKQDLIKHR